MTLPPWVGGLPALTSLCLQNNFLFCEEPLPGLEALAPRLRSLDLSSAQLCAPPAALAACTQLTLLALGLAVIGPLPSPLVGGMACLEVRVALMGAQQGLDGESGVGARAAAAAAPAPCGNGKGWVAGAGWMTSLAPALCAGQPQQPATQPEPKPLQKPKGPPTGTETQGPPTGAETQAPPPPPPL